MPFRSGALAGALFIGAALTGCADILPQGGPAPTLYTLTPKNTFNPVLPKADYQLVVEEPLAAGGLDTNKVAVMPSPYETQYYAEARWTERAPKMVQTLLIESFENTRRIVSVGRQTVGLRSDYNLKSELREFQAEYPEENGQMPIVRVRLNVKLITQPRQEIVASSNFEHVATPQSASVVHVVQAFDEALGRVLKQVVEWTLITAQFFPSRKETN